MVEMYCNVYDKIQQNGPFLLFSTLFLPDWEELLMWLMSVGWSTEKYVHISNFMSRVHCVKQVNKVMNDDIAESYVFIYYQLSYYSVFISEHFFGCVRAGLGCNNNPSPYEFIW